MKFSDGLFLDNESAGMQQKIEKLSESPSSSQNNRIEKAKQEFLHTVVDVPEFDQTVTELSTYTMEYGSTLDKGQLEKIQSKMKTGSLDYDDVVDLNTIGQKNYKHFFKKPPSTFTCHPATIIGFALTVFAIIMRWTYENNTSITTIIFLAAINIIAIIYTLCLWPNNVVCGLTSWLAENAVPDVISRKIVKPISSNLWKIVGFIFLIVIVALLTISFAKNFSLGNDIISIISLSLSILSDRIVELLVYLFEWRIYRDKKR